MSYKAKNKQMKKSNYNFPTWNVKPIVKNKEIKIRNPVKYLVEKHSMSTRYAKEFLVQPAFIEDYWKEDSSGLYIDKTILDSIGYGWKNERKMLKETIESTAKVRIAAKKAMIEDYGKILSKKEIEEKINKMPIKHQKHLRKIQRVMKKINNYKK